MGKYRVEYVPDWNLDRLIEAYPEKIKRLNEILERIYTEHPPLREHPSDIVKFLLAKIARLEDKLRVCIEERKRREREGIKVESPTAYFIDWVYGNDANDGLSPETAWKTIPQYTTNTIRTPGDIAYCRRGQTHVYDTADIIFDEDGEPNNPIILMSDDGTGWIDEVGLPRTVIDFAEADFHFYASGDWYWTFRDLEMKRGGQDYVGVFQWWNSAGWRLENCYIHSNHRADLRIEQSQIEVVDTTLGALLLGGIHIFAFDRSNLTLKNVTCTEDTQPFLNLRYLSRVWGENLKALGKIVVGAGFPGGWFEGRNIDVPTIEGVSTAFPDSYLRIEDFGGTKLDNIALYYSGNIVRDTTVVRAGGAPSSARLEPNENCGSLRPLELSFFLEELARWLEAGTRTCKMYVRCSGWTTLPTADELYLEVHYYDTVEAKRASVKSTETVTANDVWVELSVSFSLNSESPCYANIILKRYEVGAKVYVDILPIWE